MAFLGLGILACDSTVETQDGGASGAGGEGAAGGQALAKPNSCDEFAEYCHSVSVDCACSCDGDQPTPECLPLAKELWACQVEHFRPETCGSSGECVDDLLKVQECEEAN